MRIRINATELQRSMSPGSGKDVTNARQVFEIEHLTNQTSRWPEVGITSTGSAEVRISVSATLPSHQRVSPDSP